MAAAMMMACLRSCLRCSSMNFLRRGWEFRRGRGHHSNADGARARLFFALRFVLGTPFFGGWNVKRLDVPLDLFLHLDECFGYAHWRARRRPVAPNCTHESLWRKVGREERHQVVFQGDLVVRCYRYEG